MSEIKAKRSPVRTALAGMLIPKTYFPLLRPFGVTRQMPDLIPSMDRTKRSGAGKLVVVTIIIIAILAFSAVAFLFHFLPLNPSGTSLSGGSSTSSDLKSSSVTSYGQGGNAEFALELTPNVLLISPGLTTNYSSVSIVAIAVPSSGETISLSSSTSNPGLTASLSSTSANIPGSSPITLTLSSSSNVIPGTYSVVLTGTIGQKHTNSSFAIKVVPYLILIKSNQYLPSTLNAIVGASVIWMNLDGPTHMDNGNHVVKLVSGSSGESPTLHQYDTWSSTFSAAGRVLYMDPMHSAMQGEISIS